MSLTPHAKTLLSAFLLGTALSLSPEIAQAYVSVDTNDTRSSQSEVGSSFTDSFDTTGSYTITYGLSDQRAEIVLGSDNLQNPHRGFSMNTTIFITPPEGESWMTYMEKNGHWIEELVDSLDIDEIHWKGLDKESSDFISQEILAEHSHMVNSVELHDGGMFSPRGLVKVDYMKLVELPIVIYGDPSGDVERSLTSRGFSSVVSL